ncbi:hypothetical protein EAO76_00735 [Streptomyces sp. sk2.1]|nr:hypothetical protein EAO76_00735 [Streptomyces sp. sk2.1]
MAGEGVQFRAVDRNGLEPKALRLGESLRPAEDQSGDDPGVTVVEPSRGLTRASSAGNRREPAGSCPDSRGERSPPTPSRRSCGLGSSGHPGRA